MGLNSIISRPPSSFLWKQFKNFGASNDESISYSLMKSLCFLSPLYLKNASMAALSSVSVMASTSPSIAVAQSPELKIKTLSTANRGPEDWYKRSSGKKVKVFTRKNYLANWIQSGVLVLGGDGRYFNLEAAQIIIKIVAGNGVGKILVGKDGIMSTPSVSAVIRKRKANGCFIMSASHNPGGPDYDWGLKFNYSSGQPAPESITDKIYGNTHFLESFFFYCIEPSL